MILVVLFRLLGKLLNILYPPIFNDDSFLDLADRYHTVIDGMGDLLVTPMLTI